MRAFAFRPFLILALIGVLAFLCAEGLWGMAGSSARAFAVDQAEFSYPPLVCGSPCIIETSPGGVIDLFAAEGRQLVADHTPVIVDGICASACTILVDIARENVCITRNAVLAYHKGMRPSDDGPPAFEDVKYQTPGLEAYIDAHGGLPDPDSGHMLMLNFHEASQFYRPCAGSV